jgi:hypothetical protein
VQPDTRLVGQRDAGAGDVEALPDEQLEERGVQRPPDPSAMRSGVDVDGDVGRPPVGRALAVLAGVR